MLTPQTQARKMARRYREDQPATTLLRLFHEGRFSLKEIGMHPRVDEEDYVVCRWLNQSRDIPARKLPGIYFALRENLDLWNCLLEPCKLVAIHKPVLVLAYPSPMRLLGHLSFTQGRIMDVFSELLEKPKITKEDVQRLRQEAERVKHAADQAVAWAEQQLQEQQKGEKQ